MSNQPDKQDKTAAFDDVRARFEVAPISGCPGRFIIHGAATKAPEEIAGGPVTVRRFVGRSRDPVRIAALVDGGLISYEKPGGSFVHTLCDRDGYRRKLAQLEISAAASRSTKLPQPSTAAECDALDRGAPAFIAALRDVFSKHVGDRALQQTAVGSYPVFFVGDDMVAKLFSPLDKEMFDAERAVLQLLDRTAEVPSPGVVAEAQVDGWHAILMTRLPGASLAELWPTTSPQQQERVCEALGGVLRELHGIDPSPMKLLSVQWNGFAAEQRRTCAARQRARGLPDSLVAQIPAFLDSVAFDESRAQVLLHTEVMKDHVFAERGGDQLRITGLIDFEPAMLGPPEYEFAAVGLFVAGGHAQLLRAALTGYGVRPDAEWHRRIMAYTLLHRYSNVRWYLEFMPPGDSLEELAVRWFDGRDS